LSRPAPRPAEDSAGNFMLNAYNRMQINPDPMKRFLSQNQLLPLRLFYTNPEKSFYMREIGRILGKKPGVFQWTLNGLVEDGLLLSEYRGHARFFQANAGYPLYPELKKIVEKTAGVEGTLRNLCRRIKGLKLALLYGSFARGKERKDSDIDLLVVGKLALRRLQIGDLAAQCGKLFDKLRLVLVFVARGHIYT